MKKKILSLVLVSVLLMPTAAYAKGQNAKGNAKAEITTVKATKNEDNAYKQSGGQTPQGKAKGEENKLENNKQKEQFKAEIKAKHEIMKTNTKKINDLKKQIRTKKEELSSIIEDIKAGKKTLPSDQLDLLTAKADAAKEAADAVKALPAVSPDVESTQKDIKSNKFEAALSSLDKVIAKQETRYAKLVDLNAKLDALLAIARQAQPVTTDTSTSTDASSPTISNQ